MAHKYDGIAEGVLVALRAARVAGLEPRILAKGGLQSVLVAQRLGHELSAEGQGFDATDQEGNRYEYKVTSPTQPQCTFTFSKGDSIDDAIDFKIGGLSGVVVAVLSHEGVQVCYVAGAEQFASFAKAHFRRVAQEVDAGMPRRGRPRANTTAEARSLCLTAESFSKIPGVNRR